MKAIGYLKSIVLTLILATFFTGCNKVSHNGSIDGHWQIMNIEELSTGDHTTVTDQRYIGIQLHVMQLIGPGVSVAANMTYDKNDATISCDFPYLPQDQVESKLAPFGIRSNPVTFEVVESNRSTLVLRTSETIITCRRF
ncbi:MAG: lipocalin-like domain-containing protein [Muribaculaceae bacterium]|nr:lipocalin-like domain-containing protein [Muribaculaceae bacterium]